MKRKGRNRRITSLVLAGVMMLTMGSVSSFASPAVSTNEVGDSSQSYVKSSIDDGIDPAFREQKIGTLYASEKLTVKMPEDDNGPDTVEIAEDFSAGGTVISGSAEAVAAAAFVFDEEFDFGDGIVERILADGVSAKGSSVDLAFYLDDMTDAFATMHLTAQMKKNVWPEKNLVTSVYDQRITGKHRISFKLIQKDTNPSVKVKLDTVIFEKSTVPTMYFNIDESQGTIDAMNNDPDHELECHGTVSLQIPDEYEYEYSSSEEMTETVNIPFEYIRGRGNSTWKTDKKPYKIKFKENIDLFHMGANKHWVLIADYYDPSHIRNKITYWIGAQLGFAFTPQAVYVDVVMNGEYVGTYLLAEQIRVDKNRVEIDNMEKDAGSMDLSTEEGQRAMTGGYLLSFSGSEDELCHTDGDNAYFVNSPSSDSFPSGELYEKCKAYAGEKLQMIAEKACEQDLSEFSQYMDIDSAVDYYWMQEFSKNGDGFGTGSTYLYKERDRDDGTIGKFYWGPLWDFDYVAWGNNDFSVIDDSQDGGYFLSYEHYFHQYKTTFFKELLSNPVFSQKMVDRWNTKIRDLIAEAAEEGGPIDQYADQIRYAMYYNNLVYGSNYDEVFADYAFNDAVDQLKSWISRRLEWVNENTESIGLNKHTVIFMNDGKVVETSVVYEDEPIPFPDVQAPEGKVIDGWYGPDESGAVVKYEHDARLPETDGDFILELRFIDISDFPAVESIILGEDHIFGRFKSHPADEYDNVKFIQYEVTGGTGWNTPLKWSSSDEKVAVVEKGAVLFCGVGEAIITAASLDDSVKASCTVTVTEENTEVTAIDSAVINPRSVTLEIGESAVVSVIPEPANVSCVVKWAAADDEIDVVRIGNKARIQGSVPGNYQVIAVISDEEEYTIYRVCTVTIKEPSPKQEFTDVDPDEYYADPVKWAVEKEIAQGTSETTFSPDETCTRGQVVTFLWRAAGQPEPKSAENPFTDVKSGKYYEKAVLWAVENGITTGMTENTFEPDRACTRAQVVTFLHRAAGSPEPASDGTVFEDVFSDNWFGRAVVWAVENSITAGISETEFAPEMECTRGQIVTFLYRQYK